MRSIRVPLFVVAGLVAMFAPVAGQDPAGEERQGTQARQELALQTTETLEFETDEVTWMSLDVSPDGRTIVFELLGDLYTLPIAGGTATRIMGGLSFESQPVFSPDGRTIAFLSDRTGVENLWIANADGSNPRAVTRDRTTGDRPQIMASPAWTPDGQYLIVSKSRPPQGTFSLFLYHRDGSSGIQIGQPPADAAGRGGRGGGGGGQLNHLGAVVSPDGRFVYYAQRSGSFTYNAQFPLWQVYRYDRDTADITQITNARGSAMRPAISPDGRFLVYGTRHKTETGLRVRNLETGEERWLAYPVTRDDQESRASRDTLPRYTFMPDGRSLLVPVGGRLQRIDFETGAATPIPFTARVQAEIAPRVYTPIRVDDGPTVRARLIRWPVPSPDGRQVAFNAMNHLYVMDLPNGTPRRLTSSTEGEFMPAWSPDGRTLAYVTWTLGGGHIKRVAATGGQPEILTRAAGYYLDPAFTPDGTQIVYLAGSATDQMYAILTESFPDDEHDPEAPGEISGVGAPNTLELRRMPSAGGAGTLIASARGGRAPHFVRTDSTRVYLQAGGGIDSITLDGYDRRSILRVNGSGTGTGRAAEEVRMSPTGTHAFVSLQNRHYLINLIRSGETLTVRIQGAGRGGNTPVPVRPLSAEGGDYLAWSADGQTVSWALGHTLYRQAIDATSPESASVVIEAPRARPEGSVLLSGARIVTMNGDEVFVNGDILVTNNRIAGVGRRGSIRVPDGTRRIDVTGKTIIPGLVDVHAHMRPPRGLHQTTVWQYYANLAYGVTTTRDPQTSTPDVFAYADLVDAGMMPGPRVYATGPGVFAYSGIVDQESANRFIKRYKEAYETNTIKQYVAGDRLVRQWIVKACAEYGITPTIEGSLDLKLNLTQMADGYSGQEHSFPILPLYKDVVEFTARTKTFYTPTILVAYGAPWSENYWFENTGAASDTKLRKWVPWELLDGMVRRRPQWFLPEEYGHEKIGRQVADIVRAGGRAGLGSHGQLQGLGAHWEMWSMGSGGLTPHETLRVVTLFGAEALGLQQDLGSLEMGKLADLVVLDRNPLEDLQHTTAIRYVMKNGELYDADTLDMIWPVERALPTPFWWHTEPRGADPVPAGNGRAGGR
ncbi:MAG TPA: amidohydrolase family protein [Vicinamibacterales bacterium]|nr:amidohydrolase family protein [Vicinamibacterales bacterium]